MTILNIRGTHGSSKSTVEMSDLELTSAEICHDYGYQHDDDHLKIAHDTLESIVKPAKSTELTGYWHRLNGVLMRLKVVLAEKKLECSDE